MISADIDPNSIIPNAETLKKLLKYTSFNIILKNQYLEFQNIEKPVQSYIDNKYKFEVQYGEQAKIDMYVKNNQYDLSDSYMDILATKTGHFYNVDRYTPRSQTFYAFNDQSDPNHYELAIIYLRLDNREDHFERKVYSIFDLTGQMGGVFGFLESIIGFFVGYFAKKYMYFSIITESNNLSQVLKKKRASLEFPNEFTSQKLNKNEDKKEEIPISKPLMHHNWFQNFKNDAPLFEKASPKTVGSANPLGSLKLINFNPRSSKIILDVTHNTKSKTLKFIVSLIFCFNFVTLAIFFSKL